MPFLALIFLLKHFLSGFSSAICWVNSLISTWASSNDLSFSLRDLGVFSRRSSISCNCSSSFSIFSVISFLAKELLSYTSRALLRVSLSDFSRSSRSVSKSIVLLASIRDLLLLFRDVRVAFIGSSLSRSWFSRCPILLWSSFALWEPHSLASIAFFKCSFSELSGLTSSTKASAEVFLFMSSILCNWASSSLIFSDCTSRRSLSHLSCLISSIRFLIVSSCFFIMRLASSTSFSLLFKDAFAASVKFFNWCFLNSTFSFSSINWTSFSYIFETLAVKEQFSLLNLVIWSSSFLVIHDFSHVISRNCLSSPDSFDSSEDNVDFSFCNFAISSWRSLIIFDVSRFRSWNCVFVVAFSLLRISISLSMLCAAFVKLERSALNASTWLSKRTIRCSFNSRDPFSNSTSSRKCPHPPRLCSIQ